MINIRLCFEKWLTQRPTFYSLWTGKVLGITSFKYKLPFLRQALKDNEAAIQQEMIDIQGVSADVGGYYKLDEDKANAVMRPSKKFNELMDNY